MANDSNYLVNQTRRCGKDLWESVTILRKKSLERRKFKDPRRIAIYESVELSTEQKQQIDELYLKNYGEKIPYIWHRHFTAFTGHFDPNYFPELLYIPEFERFMNLDPAYARVFADKNVIIDIAQAAGVKTANTILSCCHGMFRGADNIQISGSKAKALLNDVGEVVLKPTVDSGSAKNCKLLQLEHGVDQNSGKKFEDIICDMDDDYIVQRRIKCSDEIRALNPQSCNTFRIITYRWKDKILHFPIGMRIGRQNNWIDNAHSGGVFIGISDSGILKNKAFSEFKQEHTAHPDTGIVFDGYRIPDFDKVIKAAEKMHMMISQLGVINWDFTLDESNEPLLIEANTMGGGGLWLVEMAHGVGPFGSNTEAVLNWMREMKKRKYSQRGEIAFGNI